MLILLRVQTCLQRRCGAEHLNLHLPEKTCVKSANHRFHSWEGSAKISQQHHDHWATLWHLSPSTWTLSKGTFLFLFFFPPNLRFLIIEKLVPANTAWENICEQDFLGRQRRITIKSWNVSLQSLKVISLSLGRHNECFHHLLKENVIDSIKCQRSRSKEIMTVIQSALKSNTSPKPVILTFLLLQKFKYLKQRWSWKMTASVLSWKQGHRICWNSLQTRVLLAFLLHSFPSYALEGKKIKLNLKEKN